MRGTKPTFQNIPLYRDSKAEIINPVIINEAHARKPQFNIRTFDNRDVDTRSDTTRQGRHEGNIPYGAGRGPAGESPLSILEQNVVKSDVITGSPTILPGRYSGLERISPSIFNMFKTWIKGLPKSMSTSDKVAVGTGTVIGNVLGYDDTHNQYIRKSINNVSKGLNPAIEWTPFSADNIINNFINKPQPKKFKK